MRDRILLYLPEYQVNSNGIKLLWDFAKILSKYFDVKILTFYAGGSSSAVPKCFGKHVIQKDVLKIDDFSAVVYSDMTIGNPLGCRKVIRYLMARPGMFNNGNFEEYNKNDFLIAYSKIISKKLPQLTLLNYEELYSIKSHIAEIKKNKVVVYFGKCRLSVDTSIISELENNFSEVKFIGRNRPVHKNELYSEISDSQLLISFDALSQICFEANLLGVPALILDDVFKDEYQGFNHKISGFYYDYREVVKVLTNFNHQKLSNESYRNIEALKSSEDLTVKDLVEGMQQWLNSDDKLLSTEEFNIENKRFISEVWGSAPIFICTGYKSIIFFELMRVFPKSLLSILVIKRIVLLPIFLVDLFKKMSKDIFQYFNFESVKPLLEESKNQKIKLSFFKSVKMINVIYKQIIKFRGR